MIHTLFLPHQGILKRSVKEYIMMPEAAKKNYACNFWVYGYLGALLIGKALCEKTHSLSVYVEGYLMMKDLQVSGKILYYSWLLSFLPQVSRYTQWLLVLQSERSSIYTAPQLIQYCMNLENLPPCKSTPLTYTCKYGRDQKGSQDLIN